MLIVNNKEHLKEAIINKVQEIQVSDKIFLAEMIAVSKLQNLKKSILGGITAAFVQASVQEVALTGGEVVVITIGMAITIVTILALCKNYNVDIEVQKEGNIKINYHKQ